MGTLASRTGGMFAKAIMAALASRPHRWLVELSFHRKWFAERTRV